MLVRSVTKSIHREMRRPAAVEPMIGHLKDGHRMRLNYLNHINDVLAAVGLTSAQSCWIATSFPNVLRIDFADRIDGKRQAEPSRL